MFQCNSVHLSYSLLPPLHPQVCSLCLRLCCCPTNRFTSPIFLVPYICCCCSVTQSCPTLCDPMDCNTPGFPVLHHLLEFAQTHVHWVSDAIQPSRPLSHSSPAFSLSQGFFQWVTSLLASQLWWPKTWSFSFSFSILPRNIQDWFPLGLTGLISLWSKGLSRVFSNTTVQKHQFFGAQLSSQSNSHIHTWPLHSSALIHLLSQWPMRQTFLPP